MNSLTDALRTSDVDLRQVASVVVLIGLLAPFAIYAVPQVVGADHSYVVLSGSMEPAIDVGDVVIVERVAPAAIERSDVITFTRGSEPIPTTHRVVDIVQGESGLAFETRGDANEDADPGLVPASRVVGKVAVTIPLIGYVISFVGTQLGFVLLVVLPIGLLVLTELWGWYRSRRPDSADSPAVTATQSQIPDEFQLTDRQLAAGIVVSSAVVIGSGFAAFQFRTSWLVGLATAAGGIALLLLASKYGLLDAGESSASPTTDGGVTTDSSEIPTGGAPHARVDDRTGLGMATNGHADVPLVVGEFDARGAPSVRLAETATLFDVAASTGSRIVADDRKDLLAFVADGLVYRAPYPKASTDEETEGDDVE